MQVKVGDIAASCPYCGTLEFIASESGAGGIAKLACENCGRKTNRAQLLIQIGDKAARRAADSLALLRKKRSTPDRSTR